MCVTTEKLVDKNYRRWEMEQLKKTSSLARPLELEPIEIPMIKPSIPKSVFLGIFTGLIYSVLLSVALGLLVGTGTKNFILLAVLAGGFLTGAKFGFFTMRGCDWLGGIVFGFCGMLVATVFSLAICISTISSMPPHAPISIWCFIGIILAILIPTMFALNTFLLHSYNQLRLKNITSPVHILISFAPSFFAGLLIILFVIFQFITGWK